MTVTRGARAQHMDVILPSSWRGAVEVNWTPGTNPAQQRAQPSRYWLSCFWVDVPISDVEIVLLFKDWPLLPTCRGTLLSCSRVREALYVWPGSPDATVQDIIRVTHRESTVHWQGLFARMAARGQEEEAAPPAAPAPAEADVEEKVDGGGDECAAAVEEVRLASGITQHQLHTVLYELEAPLLQPAYFRGAMRPVCLAPETVVPALLRSVAAAHKDRRLAWDALTAAEKRMLLELCSAHAARSGACDEAQCLVAHP